ncbi:MAG: DNA replication and repair protein RecF [Gemmatimonadales bacterium]|nr:MAG: DNA replication and repair protein RecF [Gemmatimonadales bacterium]
MLTHLRLSGFRNLADARLDLPAEGVALVGANAQGKTNLLEAIYYLEIFRSFRGTRDSRIIRFGEDVFRVEGHLDHGESRQVIAAAYQRSGSLKKVTVDGVEPPSLGAAIGGVAAVLFTPEDVRIVSNGPEERRRFLDIMLSLNLPGYLEDLQRYRQGLSQRNAVLRDGGEGAAVRAWNPLLSRLGGAISHRRARWVKERGSEFRSVFAEASGGEEAILSYQPGSVDEPPLEGAGPEAWGEGMAAKLDRQFESDRRRGTTQSGPHRDELRMHLVGRGESEDPPEPRDLRHFGSGGQRRTAALTLRILEARTVAQRRGRPPLLLLDDLFAELDADRSRRVVDLLDRTAAGQVILTAPKQSDLHFRSDRLVRWDIHDGRVERGHSLDSEAP